MLNATAKTLLLNILYNVPRLSLDDAHSAISRLTSPYSSSSALLRDSIVRIASPPPLIDFWNSVISGHFCWCTDWADAAVLTALWKLSYISDFQRLKRRKKPNKYPQNRYHKLTDLILACFQAFLRAMDQCRIGLILLTAVNICFDYITLYHLSEGICKFYTSDYWQWDIHMI